MAGRHLAPDHSSLEQLGTYSRLPCLDHHCFHLAQSLNFSLPKKGKKAFLLHPPSSQHWATPPSPHSARALRRALLTRLGPVWREEATDEVDGFITQHAVSQVKSHQGRVESQGRVQQGQSRIRQRAPVQAEG